MLLVCPNCSTSYQVGASALGAGRSVRCASCRTVWFANPEQARQPVLAEMAGEAADASGGHWAESSDPDQALRVTASPRAEPRHETLTEWTPVSGHETDSDAADWVAEASFIPPTLVPEGDETSQDFPAAEEEEAWIGQTYPDTPLLAPNETDEMTFAPAPRRRAASRGLSGRGHGAAGRARWRMPIRPLPLAVTVLAAVAFGLLFWRASIVRLLPQTASFYAALGMPVNLRNVVFENVRTTQEMHEGIPVLVVEGSIVGIGKRPAEAQRLRFSLRNEAGNEIYSWTALPSRSIVEPGDSVPFRSRLASPPAEGREVIVRFFNRRDSATATR